jgi:hypothetical protein
VNAYQKKEKLPPVHAVEALGVRTEVQLLLVLNLDAT